MIFTRRAIQKRLTELRTTIGDEAVEKLAARLNKPSKDRLAAMWEVVVFQGLARHGTLHTEVPLPSGRRPDVSFDNGAIRLIADITAVSDEGLDDDNPYFELSRLIQIAKAKLGLPIGGTDLRVKSKPHHSARGTRTRLLLPPRKQLQAFVRDQVAPRLREQIAAGEKVLRLSIDDNDVGLEITIDPTKPFSTGGFAAYDAPQIKDRNPLYSALKAKADQLRGAQDIAGVIVGDGDCAALADRRPHWNGISTAAIVEEFFRQHSSIDFVLVLTVRQKTRLWLDAKPAVRWVHPMLFVRSGSRNKLGIEAAFATMLAEMPKPVMMPANGALRARESEYDLGHHGGSTVEGKKIRISSRELVEVLAGLRRLDDDGAKNIEAIRSKPRPPNPAQNAFFRNLTEGRLPSTIIVFKDDENENDDWVEFEFGEADPAISPFK